MVRGLVAASVLHRPPSPPGAGCREGPRAKCLPACLPACPLSALPKGVRGRVSATVSPGPGRARFAGVRDAAGGMRACIGCERRRLCARQQQQQQQQRAGLGGGGFAACRGAPPGPRLEDVLRLADAAAPAPEPCYSYVSGSCAFPLKTLAAQEKMRGSCKLVAGRSGSKLLPLRKQNL